MGAHGMGWQMAERKSNLEILQCRRTWTLVVYPPLLWAWKTLGAWQGWGCLCLVQPGWNFPLPTGKSNSHSPDPSGSLAPSVIQDWAKRGADGQSWAVINKLASGDEILWKDSSLCCLLRLQETSKRSNVIQGLCWPSNGSIRLSWSWESTSPSSLVAITPY